MPPWVRPGWLELPKSQRRYAVTQYNLSRDRRGYAPIPFNPNHDFPPGYSPANINSSFPPLGKAYKAALRKYINEQRPGLGIEDINYFTTTEAPAAPVGARPAQGMEVDPVQIIDEIVPEDQLESEAQAEELNSEAAETLAEFDLSLLSPGDKQQANKRKGDDIEKPGGKRKDKTNYPARPDTPPDPRAPAEGSSSSSSTTPTTTTSKEPAVSTPETEDIVPQQPDEGMVLTGTGSNGTSQSEGGGESGFTRLPKNKTNGTKQNYTFSKNYKIKLVGNAPAVIEETLAGTTFVTRLLATNLREMPVQYLGAYLTPAEWDFLKNKKGVKALHCRVKVAKKSTAAAFQTNNSTTETAVLNYNKTFKYAKGLNEKQFYCTKSISAFSPTNRGMPTTLAAPVNWNSVMATAWATQTANTIPAGVTFTSITAPNIFCQQVAAAANVGWQDHSKCVHTFDDNSPPFIAYEYQFKNAPLTPDYDNYFQIYPNRTRDTDNIDISVYDRHSTANRKRSYLGKTYALTTQVEQTIARDYPLNLMTGFNIDQRIEKSDLVGGETEGEYSMQPSLHVGIGEVAAHGVFTGLTTAAGCFPTKFVEIFGEVWVTMELEVSWYEPAPFTMSQTAPMIHSDTVQFTSDKNCPKVTDHISRYKNLPYEVESSPVSCTYGVGIAVPTANSAAAQATSSQQSASARLAAAAQESHDKRKKKDSPSSQA